MLALGNVLCIWKEGELLPALAVAFSLFYDKGGIGGSSFGWGLWAEICWIPLVEHSNLIEK